MANVAASAARTTARAARVRPVQPDVFEIEPLLADHALWAAPNVLITPHTAGYGPYLDDRRLDILLDNCRRFAAGKPTQHFG